MLLVFVTREPDGLYYVWVRDDRTATKDGARGTYSVEHVKPTWTYAFKAKARALQQMRETAGHA